MNLNDLRTALDNIVMKFGHIPKEEIAFSNAEIILLGDFTISGVKYDGEYIFFQLNKFKFPATEITESFVEADNVLPVL